MRIEKEDIDSEPNYCVRRDGFEKASMVTAQHPAVPSHLSRGINTCEPIRNDVIDLWHANATVIAEFG